MLNVLKRIHSGYLAQEDRIFALVARAEIALKLVPAGTRLKATSFQRWLLRFFVTWGSLLFGVFAFASGRTRTQLLLALALPMTFAVLALLFADARTKPQPPKKRR